MAQKSPDITVKTGETAKYIVYGVAAVAIVGIAYFGIIKPITNAIGLTRSREERKGDKASEKLTRKQVLSPLFYRHNKDKVTINSGRANELADKVYNGKGYIYDDETMAVGAITSAGSLVNISYIADVFQRNTGKSMETYMESYLEPNNWTQIDAYIDKVKKF